MVESNLVPIPLRMAVLALLPISSTVNIVQFMTGITIRGDVFVAFIGMTTFAVCFSMFVNQGKLGFVVVEFTL